MDWLDALADAAVVVGRDNLVTAANTPARDMLQTEPKGIAITALVRTGALFAALEDVRRAGNPVQFEFEMRGAITRQFGVHVAPIPGGGLILLAFRDLTREQAIERMRSDFVANVSHELRTPLTSIMGAIETVQGAAKNDAKARDSFLGSMMTQAQRMKRLVDDLLALSRIELNEHVRPNAAVALTAIAKQAIDNLKPLAKELAVDISLADEGSAVVSGDPDELLQVAQNLLENAIKYGKSGGRVELTCGTEGRNAFLAVRDFGAGIAEIHLPRLTERFYRVNTRESRALGGTGLGLAIVKHIVSRHRGKLHVASKPGEGSTFTVSIPVMNSWG